jgi:hypothetical protein
VKRRAVLLCEVKKVTSSLVGQGMVSHGEVKKAGRCKVMRCCAALCGVWHCIVLLSVVMRAPLARINI